MIIEYALITSAWDWNRKLDEDTKASKISELRKALPKDRAE